MVNPRISKREVQELLGRVPLFSGCSKRELVEIASAAKGVDHPEGHVLAKEGERGIGFFLITDGSAVVTVGGRSRAKLGPGDFFGEISLLDEGPRSATVTATSPVKTVGITAWTFKGLIEQHPSIALRMLEMVAARVRKASATVV
jgi:CRP/FNR family transcriptional regulator, cyclic AMP receptor protein